MTQKTKVHHQSRDFLNKELNTPAIIISQVSTYHSKDYVDTDNAFKISDCSRAVSLDIDFFNAEGYQNAIDKLKLIENVILDTMKALSEQQELQTELQAEIDKKKTKRQKKKTV